MTKQFISGYRLSFLFLYGILIFLSLNRHSHSGYYNYHSEIWADKAGYYVYLPAALKFGFDPSQFPDSIEQKTGFGFKFEPEKKIILTKYTYGVALLQLPFYLLADVLAKPLGYENNGFSPIYYKFIDLAAVTYLLIGLHLLYLALKSVNGNGASSFIPILLLLATHLYYYAIDETGMSHVYSFSLFCAFLYLLRVSHFLIYINTKTLFLFATISSLIILIRPINGLIVLSYFFLDLKGPEEFYSRFRNILNGKKILLILIAFIIIVIPQFLYWRYSQGSYLSYSYGEEGFTWTKPQLLKVWFSPYNGLFLYCPFYLLLIGLAVYMSSKKMLNGLFLTLLFLALSYILSCWWDPGFGCSFGARSFVEYLALFCLPLAGLFRQYKFYSPVKKVMIVSIIVLCIAYNLKMTYSYDGCFYGHKNWDWDSFLQHLYLPTK